MAHDETDRTDRRTFLQAGALATAAAVSLTPGLAAQELVAKTAGASQAEAGQDRRRDHDARGRARCRSDRTRAPARLRQRRPHLRHRQGLRHRARLQEVVRAGRPRSARRSSWSPRTSRDAPRRCWRWSTSGWRPWGPTTSTSSSSTAWATTHSLDEAINMVKSQEFKETADAIRKSGKAKFLGFSTHHKDRAPIIQAAAEGGIVDAIMLQYTALARQGLRRSTRRSTPAGRRGSA